MTKDDHRPSKGVSRSRPVSLNHPAFGRRATRSAERIAHPSGAVLRKYVVALDSNTVQPTARRYDEKGEARLARAVAVAITGLPLKIIAVHVTERYEEHEW